MTARDGSVAFQTEVSVADVAESVAPIELVLLATGVVACLLIATAFRRGWL